LEIKWSFSRDLKEEEESADPEVGMRQILECPGEDGEGLKRNVVWAGHRPSTLLP
jgi:hypothetical protein